MDLPSVLRDLKERIPGCTAVVATDKHAAVIAATPAPPADTPHAVAGIPVAATEAVLATMDGIVGEHHRVAMYGFPDRNVLVLPYPRVNIVVVVTPDANVGLVFSLMKPLDAVFHERGDA